MRAAFVALFILALPANAQTSTEVQRFSVYVSGLKAGTLQTVITKNGKAFSVSGTLSPTRFKRSIRDVGYAGQSSGTFGKTFTPRRYSGHTKTGDRTSKVQMRFNGGVPSVDSYQPEREPRDYDIDPAKQRGVIAPLTAAATVFRDQPSATLCNRTIPMFDGRRRSELTLAPPTSEGDSATCTGTYTRIAGFSPQDMQERVNFPFTLMYTRINADTYRLTSFTTKTTFGSLRAKRK